MITIKKPSQREGLSQQKVSQVLVQPLVERKIMKLIMMDYFLSD
ncbi:hypothetical protein F3D3_1832 [Fusibacter sp. 3D3]|nr:hypothetical protein F3D3_1832 [Fusibacter sp. 3D3]